MFLKNKKKIDRNEKKNNNTPSVWKSMAYPQFTMSGDVVHTPKTNARFLLKYSLIYSGDTQNTAVIFGVYHFLATYSYGIFF